MTSAPATRNRPARSAGLFSLALALAGCTTQSATGEPIPAGAGTVHERLLTLDTHLDTPIHFSRRGWSMADRHDIDSDTSQVDLVRMDEGGLDGGFFVIYTPQGALTAAGYAEARAAATRRQQEILDMAAANADRVALAYSADDAARIAAQGKVFAFQSIENSWPLGEDVSALRDFYERGVRMAGPVHSADNQFADSTTGEGRWGGLSPLGRELIAEMNRLGIVVDASHASDAAFDEMIELSATPMVLSHSGPRALYDHPRNLDDARIRRLADSGGAICVNSIFLADPIEDPAREEFMARAGDYAELPLAEQQALIRQYRAIQGGYLRERADVDLLMTSLLHLLDVAGVDHVCMGFDWDGGGGVAGMRDITGLPQVTERLLAAGYSEADLEKIWSGNVLRLMRQAEAYASQR